MTNSLSIIYWQYTNEDVMSVTASGVESVRELANKGLSSAGAANKASSLASTASTALSAATRALSLIGGIMSIISTLVTGAALLAITI